MAARILLVEDNPTNLQLMEYLLRAFGHETITATDGAIGVATAVRESPDIILMDLQMPTLNGYDAARQIRGMPALKHIPIVAVTAFAMVGDRDRILAHGFDGYIAKPIAPETFVMQVEQFLPKPAKPPFRTESAPAGAAHVPEPVGAGRAILVVDNSPANLHLARSIFEPFGYEVLVADSVSAGLDLARRLRPDLILSDVHMPEQTGYEFLRLIKADETLRSVPFVFISSTVWGEADRSSGLEQGADDFILRPIEPFALVAAIARHIRGSRGKR